jgi:hypothetical protein
LTHVREHHHERAFIDPPGFTSRPGV